MYIYQLKTPLAFVCIWKLLHSVLPTSENLSKQAICVDGVCPFCGDEQESANHLFRDCSIIQKVWQASNLGLYVRLDRHVPLHQWVRLFFCFIS